MTCHRAKVFALRGAESGIGGANHSIAVLPPLGRRWLLEARRNLQNDVHSVKLIKSGRPTAVHLDRFAEAFGQTQRVLALEAWGRFRIHVRPSSGYCGESPRARPSQVRSTDAEDRGKGMSVKRMDNVLVVVDDLEAMKAFFLELGLTLEGEATVEGPAVGALIGLPEVKATLVTLRTPDGQGVELDKFHTPVAVRSGPESAPVNALGLRRIMFEVDEIDAVVSRMLKHGADLIGEMNYDDTYQLAYLRGPEGIIVALAEQLK